MSLKRQFPRLKTILQTIQVKACVLPTDRDALNWVCCVGAKSMSQTVTHTRLSKQYTEEQEIHDI